MLDHLRQRVVEALQGVGQVTLSSYGPAGIQAGPVQCAAHGMDLYLLVPSTSDQILNLERPACVVVNSTGWQVQGRAQLVAGDCLPSALDLAQLPDARWCRILLVRPRRVHLRHAEGWGYVETIDID